MPTAYSTSLRVMTEQGVLRSPKVYLTGAPLGVGCTEGSNYITLGYITLPKSLTLVGGSFSDRFTLVLNGENNPIIAEMPYNDGIEHDYIVFESGYKITVERYSETSSWIRLKKPDDTSAGAAYATAAPNTYFAAICFFEYNGKYSMTVIDIRSYGTEHLVDSWGTETGNALNLSIAPPDPYGLEDNSTPIGGYGEFDYSSEDILPPSAPSLSAVNCGFVSLWNPTLAEMQALASYLWSGGFDLSQWRKLFTDPMECILSVGIVPVLPTTGVRSNIQFGAIDTGIESAPVTTQFVIEDMGTIDLRGQSASYMDYAPYARASIYLPYCGTYALDIDDIMDAVIALQYHIDIYTGACVAHITITRTNSDGHTLHSTLYQFTGNCLATIPITAADHSSFLQSLLFMGAAIGATVATSGAAAPIAGAAAAGDAVAGTTAAITAGSAINTVMSMKPDIQRSGNLSSTAGFLGQQKPYLTIKWSNLCRPEDEYKLKGMPLHRSGTLSDFKGFTVVSAVHMDNLYCTEAERDMIETALLTGVII